MDLDEVKKRVADIGFMQGDDEAAHSNEDDLHVDFIRHVAAAGTPELAEMAKEILKVCDMDFARWCA